MAEIKKIQLGSTEYEISALYIQNGEQNMTWSDITDLVENHVSLVVLESLPEANATNYNKYKANIVLVPNSGTGSNVKDEYVILRSGTSGSYTYRWELIGTTEVDLSGYALKSEAAEAGTYTTSGPSSDSTGSAGAGTYTTTAGGAQTATGTATVSYQKADNVTGSAGAGEADNTGKAGGFTINGSNFNFVGTSVTLSQAAGVGSVKIDNHVIENHTHTVNEATLSIGSASGWNAGSVPTRASFNYVSGGETDTFLKGVKATGTANVNNDAIKEVTLAASTVTTAGPKYVEDITYTAASLTGTKSFNIDGIKNVEVVESSVTTAGPAYLKDVTYTAASLGTATTGSVGISGGTASLTTKNYGFSASASDIMCSPTVNNGVLSWGSLTAGTQDALASTPASLTGTKTFVTGYNSFNGGSLVKDGKYMGTTYTAASNGTVGINGGSIDKTIRYMGHTVTAAGTVSVVTGVGADGTGDAYVSLATASAYQITGVGSAPQLTVTNKTVLTTGTTLSAAGGVTLNHTQVGTAAADYKSLNTDVPAVSIAYTPSGSITGSQTVAEHSHSYTKPVAHTHSIGLSTVTVTGTAAVAVSDHTHEVTIASHTHTLGNHTHSVTLPAIQAA